MRKESTYFTINPRLIQIQEGKWGARGQLWPSCAWNTRSGMQECFRLLGLERAGGVLLCHSQDKASSRGRKTCDRDTSLSYRGRMLCDTKVHWSRDEGVGRVGLGVVTPPVLTVGLKMCSSPHVRVPGEQLLCFQPVLAISAPTCAWGPLQPLATSVLLHPSRAPQALSNLPPAVK